MSLIDELGLDPDNFDWSALALCQGLPTEDYYDLYEESPQTARAVDEGCSLCPVRKECLLYGIENKEWGVWGGFYLDGTGKIDHAKNSHKTEEDWNNLRELLTNE